jgi:hypothetical protein
MPFDVIQAHMDEVSVRKWKVAILLAANVHLRRSNYEFPRHFSRGLCCDCFFTADDVSDDKESQAQWEVSTMAIRLRVEDCRYLETLGSWRG